MISSSESPSISISLPSESLSYSSTWLESATDASVTCGMLISLTKLNATSATTGRTTNSKQKRLKTYCLQTLHWRHIFTVGYQQTRHWTIHQTSQLTSPYNQIHGWNLRNRNYISGYSYIQLKGERFKEQSILDKPTETFQYTHYTSCHPSIVKIGFVKGEALRFLRTNSSENISNFKTRLLARGYPRNLIAKILSEIKFTGRK